MVRWSEEQFAAIKAKKKGASRYKGAAPPPKVSTPHLTRLKIVQTTDEDKLNKTEKAWLEVLRSRPEVTHIGIQDHTLKLGHDTRYTPDFMTLDTENQVIFWEVKGFMRDDARVKIYTAARKFPFYRFILVTRDSRTSPFKTKDILP